MKPVIFGLAVVLPAACGRQQPNPEQAADYAAEAVRLFTRACAAHNGDTQQTAAWAAQHGLQPLDATAVKQLPAGMMETAYRRRFPSASLFMHGCCRKAAKKSC